MGDLGAAAGLPNVPQRVPPTAGLWHDGDFRRLWLGQTISLVGSEVSGLTLGATPVQMGLLGALEQAPWFAFGLFAGVWVDRARRRPIMIAADFGRATLLGAVPLAALAGALNLSLLGAVIFLSGILTVFFYVSHQSYLPSLVPREHLVEANSKLEISRSASQIGGPGLAGALTQVIAPPLAVALDALSFAVSALLIGGIKAAEPAPPEPAKRLDVWAEVREGLRAVAAVPVLRAMAAAAGTYNLFATAMTTLYALYAVNELGLPPFALGLALAAGSFGFVPGAVAAGRLARFVGLGPAMIGALALIGLADMLVPFAGGPVAAATALLIVAGFAGTAGAAVLTIHGKSLRQAITAPHLLGRVNATYSVLSLGTPLLGAMLGGLLGEAIGIRQTMLAAAVGQLLSVAFLLFSPIRSLREMPASAGAGRGPLA